MNEPSVKDTVKNILAQFSGQAATLTIQRAYIKATGSLEAALLLSQIIYWSDRTSMKDGWFAKSYQEWEDELTLSKYQVMKAVAALKIAGVEKTLKKFNGAPTVHYRLDMDVFLQWIVEKLDNPGLSKNSTIESQETSQSSTENTTEITKEPITPNGVKRSIRKSRTTLPAETINPMKDALVTAFGWSWTTMTTLEKGLIQKTAKELCEAALAPDRVESLYAYCKAQFTTPGPRALSKHLSEWRKKRLEEAPKSTPTNIVWYTPGIDPPPPAAVSDEEIPF